jgi:hypothetical protein
VSSLVVYDTYNADKWAIMDNLEVNPPLMSDATDIWVDYAICYITSLDPGAPPLAGKEWIRTMSASKLYVPSADAGVPYAEAKITLSRAANVYLIVDDRAIISVNPAANGWTDTAFNLHIWEKASTPDRPFSIFVKANQTGDVYLPIQNNNGAFNYFVVLQ